MSVPRRWIDDGGSATPFERDILRSALSMEPPPAAQDAVWGALLTKLPPPTGPFGGGGAGAGGKVVGAAKAAAGAKGAAVAAGGALGAGMLKSALIGAGGAVALIAGYAGGNAVRHHTSLFAPPAAVAPASNREAAPPAMPALAPPGARPAGDPAVISPPGPAPLPGVTPLVERRTAPEPRAVPGPAEGTQAPADPSPGAASATSGAPSGAERETMLKDESRLVREAREALRRGDAPGALTQLEQIRARYPGGVLVQEREALAIEALARSGRRSESSARAAAFLKAYPTSPLAERVQTFAQ